MTYWVGDPVQSVNPDWKEGGHEFTQCHHCRNLDRSGGGDDMTYWVGDPVQSVNPNWEEGGHEFTQCHPVANRVRMDLREIKLVEVMVGGMRWWMPIGYIDGEEAYRGERRENIDCAYKYALDWMAVELR